MRSRNGSLHRRIVDLAAEVFEMAPTDLDETSSPETVDNWDSYAGMEFVLALEQEFDLRLRTADILRIQSVGQAVEVVSAAIGVGSSEAE